MSLIYTSNIRIWKLVFTMCPLFWNLFKLKPQYHKNADMIDLCVLGHVLAIISPNPINKTWQKASLYWVCLCKQVYLIWSWDITLFCRLRVSRWSVEHKLLEGDGQSSSQFSFDQEIYFMNHIKNTSSFTFTHAKHHYSHSY